MEHKERPHAELGGSSADKWVNCSGCVSLIRTLPPSEPNKAMLLGTKKHECAEMLVEDFLNHKITGSDPEIRAHLLYTDDILEVGRGYRDVIWKEVLHESITGKAYGMEDKFTIHERLGIFGYVDFWAVYVDDRAKRVGAVVDLKSGYYKADDNNITQLAFYAAALREEIKAGGKDLDKVIGAIYQPNSQDGVPYKEIEFSSKQLDSWKRKFLNAAEKILVKKEAKFKVGPWCKTCRANAICKAYGKDLHHHTSLALLEVEDVSALPTPEQIPDEVLKNIILREDEVIAFLKACKGYALKRTASGKPISGLKAVAGASRRKWIDDEKLIGTILSSILMPEMIWNMKIKGITEIEKNLGAKADKKQLIAPLTEKTPPKPLLVSDDDLRPALTFGVDLLSEYDEE